jgi:hypothetical protein
MKTLIEAQYELFCLRAQRAQAEIVSGAYKLYDITHCGVQLTDEQKLLSKVEEMNRHLELATDCAQYFPPYVKE